MGSVNRMKTCAVHQPLFPVFSLCYPDAIARSDTAHARGESGARRSAAHRGRRRRPAGRDICGCGNRASRSSSSVAIRSWHEEVNRPACRQQGSRCCDAPAAARRSSRGPAALMYAVVLSYALRPELRPLDAAHRAVLDVMLQAIAPLALAPPCRGTSDLAIGERKISGNSMRARRNAFLYHGTLLYDFSPALVETCLPMPPRQPEYRQRRRHGDFLANIPASAQRCAKPWPRPGRQPLSNFPGRANSRKNSCEPATAAASGMKSGSASARRAHGSDQPPPLAQIPLGADQADEQQKEGPGVPGGVLDERTRPSLFERLFLDSSQQIGQLFRRERLSAGLAGHGREAGQQRRIGDRVVELQVLFDRPETASGRCRRGCRRRWRVTTIA